ncbi:sialate O-acetylesterase [Coraliomargarita parva]|uniref:sialate O-acetylesterase n=1 Tax=Coraliomargarita parva TaxID=3014050 RepID=UPI0022B2D4B6|nr:sialate O-acetylesterase [Coraliomargarita parva]
MKNKLCLFLCALLPLASHWLQADAPSGKLDLYLLIGQSNMAGRAPYTKAESQPMEGVYLLNGSDEWQPAANPLNLYSTIRKEVGMQKMGPGYGFSLAMREAKPDLAIGLIVNAKGGTSIQQWTKGDTFYDEAIRRTKIAMQSGTLKGILWHQGESDASDEKYLQKIEQLIADLRKDLDAPELPFVAGMINDTKDYPVNRVIVQLPERVAHTAVVSNEGLVIMDQWHFNHDSALTLGERYAEKMLELQATK